MVVFPLQLVDASQVQHHRNLQSIELKFKTNVLLNGCPLKAVPQQNLKEILTADRSDIWWAALLEQQLQWINVIEFHSRYAANEAIIHRFIFTNVHVLNVIELSIRRIFDIEMILLWLIIVNLFSKMQNTVNAS